MLQKEEHFEDGRPVVQVTFTLPNSFWADTIHLVGDFNGWDRRSHPLTRDRDGRWEITLCLEPQRAYQFRYLIDGHRWTNDDNADAYVRNLYGTDNFMVVTDLNFEKYSDDGGEAPS